MDLNRKKKEPDLVCTCNDLSIEDIQEAIDDGEVNYNEIMQYHYTMPRCGDCECHVRYLVTGDNSQCEVEGFTCGETNA